ncbi:citryl-CoA lyase [Bordetella tumulicola]|uniref:citryl-CoA lyase n=1 Tax=Bordetella tumulicola TaxID=1649133 RepID=UPI0039F074D4
MADNTLTFGTSSIAKVEPDRITIRGRDLCDELIGKISFTHYFLFLLTGQEPTRELVAITDACLVAIAEHGFVPSIQAARMTYAAAPDALQGAVSAGLLGCGTVILGASETAGILLADILKRQETDATDIDTAAIAVLRDLREARLPVPGFGHPVHKAEDPRATRLLKVANELGVAGKHVEALQAVERHIETAYGRFLPLNVSAAIPAVLLDADFPLESLRGVPLVARTGSLVAHLLEEQRNPLGFKIATRAEQGIAYDGQLAGKRRGT